MDELRGQCEQNHSEITTFHPDQFALHIWYFKLTPFDTDHYYFVQCLKHVLTL